MAVMAVVHVLLTPSLINYTCLSSKIAMVIFTNRPCLLTTVDRGFLGETVNQFYSNGITNAEIVALIEKMYKAHYTPQMVANMFLNMLKHYSNGR